MMIEVYNMQNACKPLERVRDDMTATLQSFQKVLEDRQPILAKGDGSRSDSYDTSRRGIDTSPFVFHSESDFIINSEENSYDHAHQEAVKSCPETPEDHVAPAVSSLSVESTKLDSSVTSKEPSEDQETQTRRSRERSELVKALENFKKFEREKAKQSRSNRNSRSISGDSRRRNDVTPSIHAVNEKVLYTDDKGEIQSATILKVNVDNNNDPLYEIRLHVSGAEMQTDNAHLSDLPKSEKSKSSNRSRKMIRQSSATSLRSTSSSQTMRRARTIGRHKSAAFNKVSSTGGPGRLAASKSRSTSHLLQQSQLEPSDLSNSTWDLETRTSSLQHRRTTRHHKLHRPNSTSPSVSSTYPRKQLERGSSARAILNSHRSQSLHSVLDYQNSTGRKPLRRTKSIDHSGLVVSLKHDESNVDAPTPDMQVYGSSQRALSAHQSFVKKTLPSQIQSCVTILSGNQTPRGEHQVTDISDLPSQQQSTLLPENGRSAENSSPNNSDDEGIDVLISAVKQRPKAFLLWNKAKSMSSLLPRQQNI